MERKKVRLGIIGVGQIGKSHLDTYRNVPDCELVAMADVDAAEGQKVAQTYNIPNVYTDFRKLLERDDLDAVDVCLHNNFHAPVTMAVLKSGKHAYCEKPMAGSYCDAAEMLKTARATGRMLHIQLAMLYSNETYVAKTLIDAGQLGKIYHARSTGWRRRGRPFVDGYGREPFVQKSQASGGALYDMGVYHISQLLYLLGNPPMQRVSGRVCQETEMDAARKASSGYNVEELGLGLVHFADGLTMDIIEAWAVHMNRFEGSSIFGHAGGVRLEPFCYFRNLGDLELDTAVDLQSAAKRRTRLRPEAKAYESSQHHWVAALAGTVPLLPTAEIALNTMLISEGIYRSSELGREVTAEEVVKMSCSTAVKV